MLIKPNEVVLFQGDSTSDCGRSRDNDEYLGYGHPSMISSYFKKKHESMNVKFINRAISGNRVKDLQNRWQKDCIDINPDWVSILIGINDTWRRYDSNDPTSAETFEAEYRDILTQVKEKTKAKIIMVEPFLFPEPPEKQIFREDLDPKIQVVRKLAAEFAELLIPMDGLFASACINMPSKHWSEDGVHPTLNGHAFIASTWMKAMGF